jgi:hypothetical protein
MAGHTWSRCSHSAYILKPLAQDVIAKQLTSTQLPTTSYVLAPVFVVTEVWLAQDETMILSPTPLVLA